MKAYKNKALKTISRLIYGDIDLLHLLQGYSIYQGSTNFIDSLPLENEVIQFSLLFYGIHKATVSKVTVP